jgi:HK97 family phage major capsid protein
VNWRIQRLQQQRAALVKQSESPLDAGAKDDRELTAEEQTSYDANAVELKLLAGKILREEELAAFAQMAEVTPVDGPAAGTSGNLHKTAVTVGNARAAFEQDDKCGFKSPREFCLAVIQNSDRPSQESRDDRLRFLATAGSDEQGGYSDPYGGFLVPVGFSPDFLQLRPEDDPIGARVTNVPMTSPRVEIPARVDKDHTTSVSGGLTVTRRAETQTQSATRMQMEKVVLSAYSLFGLAYATEEILSDSPISFAAILEKGFKDQFTYKLTDERLNGTGVGEFEGIMNSPSLVSAAKDTNQTATTITGTNVVNMRARCWQYSRAIWLANHDCLPQLAQVCLTVGTNQYPISLYHQSMKEDLPDTLCGRPIFYTEYCKTLGTKGDLLLTNWAEFLEGTYEQLQSAASIHVRFVNHERTFKFWLRNAGKCWWRSPLTTKNSTNTLSPFVSLDVRA